MAKVDQLEIIMPDGQVYFLDLDPARGITNIGRHPENDVVIDSPSVAEFQAVLDHRQKPFSLLLLTDEGDVSLDGSRLSANAKAPLQNWDTVSIAGVSIVVIEGDGTASVAVSPEAAAASAKAAEAGASKSKPATKKATRAPEPVYQILGAPPPDMSDDVISLELPERAFTIDVNQTAVWRLTIINGGPLVAEFSVAVTGIEEPWLQLLPPKVNLNEGQRTTITITVTPPRSPSSRAGNHHFAIVVTSPDYPGHKVQLGATLTIKPYYEYGVGELSPRQLNVGYLKRTSEATLTIANKGNSTVPYEVVAEDDQKGCTFEFMVPGETVGLAKQAEVRIEPDQVLMLPVKVTPLKKMLLGARKRSFSLTVTTTPTEGEQSPRSVLGQIDNAPLIGPLLIMLMVVVLLFFIGLIFRPWIKTFSVTSSAAQFAPGAFAQPGQTTLVIGAGNGMNQPGAILLNQAGDGAKIQAGETVRFSWEASPFTGLRIDPDIGLISNGQTSIVVSPAVNTKYTLVAENLLTKISDVWFKDHKDILIEVVPVLPKITTFDSDKKDIVIGETATVFWQVQDATKVELEINGAPETLDPGQYTSRRQLKLTQDTTIIIKATNRYNESQPVQQNLSIRTSPATPTPVPTPNIAKFDVNPKVITAGMPVRLEWDVLGVNEVQITGIPGATTFNPQGTADVNPAQTTVYVLTAGTGSAKITRQWQVIVNPAPPTATPTPEPKVPVIEFFTVTPNQVVKGNPEANSINLTWSVLSGTTNIQISGPSLASPLQNLSSRGSITVAASSTTLFILTAFNGSLTASAQGSVTLIDPSPTPLPTPTGTPPPTSTPIPTPFPLPIINSFFAVADPADGNARVTQVISAGAGTGTTVFSVKYGSKIQLYWTTSGAQTVNLVGLGSQPLSGNTVSPSTLVVNSASQYVLQATNPGGTVNAFVQITLAPIPAPPAPYNITKNNETTSSVQIGWSYDTAYVFDIIGFRIYKAPQGQQSFVKVIAEAPIVPNGPVVTNTATYWVDTSLPVCGQQYYIVGVYRDTAGNPQETAVGVPSILTDACPTANTIPGNFDVAESTLWLRSTFFDALLPSQSFFDVGRRDNVKSMFRVPQYQ